MKASEVSKMIEDLVTKYGDLNCNLTFVEDEDTFNLTLILSEEKK